ncbi:MAG: short-chain dehydrogenase/reductase [Frankiales bacterium]|jgi:3-oxoacyl-[acyl-carrier protein] reductase|nr:short-chain dehydrogenase/reductase [Frankiales bacterium]
MDLGLAGKVFVVTGGSRGLGRAAAESLRQEGAELVLCGRDPGAVARTADELGVIGVVADLTDPQTPARLVEAAQAAYGRLDGALISVGGPPTGSALTVSDEQWRASFESVFLGPVRLSRAVVEALPDEGGAVAFVLSTSVKQPIPGLAASNGLRPGLAMLAKTMADELGPRGIRVNGLLPGRILTDRLRGLLEQEPEDDARTIPLGRYGEPAEFGRVAAFVLSPAASYLSGTMIAVDGGAMRAL